MQFTLTIEDTTKGIRATVKGGVSGVQDHPGDSLAVTLLGQIGFHLSMLKKAGAIVAEGNLMDIAEHASQWHV